MKSLEAKIVVLGSQGVGKTSVVSRYVGQMFKHVSPTIGASFFTCRMSLDDYRVKLQVWDTAGQERFRSMAPMYYRKANAAMLVYDITSLETFEDMKSWVKELKTNVDSSVLVLCVLGNKCDLSEEREVQTDDAQEYAAGIGAMFYETSALTNEGVQEAFLDVAKAMIETHKNIPDSGLNVMDQYTPGESVNATHDTLNVHNKRSNLDEPRGRCCSS